MLHYVHVVFNVVVFHVHEFYWSIIIHKRLCY